MDRSRIAIVIPALNESATIATVITAAKKYGVPIVVDDGSTDATAELAEQSGAVVVLHSVNRGYDGALNSGFLKAVEIGCDLVITVDADGQHNPLLIQKFVDAIDAGADVVVGVRSRKQRIAEHIFALYSSWRFGIKDPLCGMKAYRIAVFKELGHFDSYESIGTELTIFAVKNNYEIKQVPFNVLERQGRSRFGQALKGNMKIFRAALLSMWRIKSIRNRF
jgi:glycosyltransferase involved in cell wall biosynthesis